MSVHCCSSWLFSMFSMTCQISRQQFRIHLGFIMRLLLIRTSLKKQKKTTLLQPHAYGIRLSSRGHACSSCKKTTWTENTYESYKIHSGLHFNQPFKGEKKQPKTRTLISTRKHHIPMRLGVSFHSPWRTENKHVVSSPTITKDTRHASPFQAFFKKFLFVTEREREKTRTHKQEE